MSDMDDGPWIITWSHAWPLGVTALTTIFRSDTAAWVPLIVKYLCGMKTTTTSFKVNSCEPIVGTF